uniref:Uncharacterized protein n=1 Tax=Anguilla anguilla TaxID=7936 RepID=A0A0E9X1V2_ANGAN
MEWLDCIQEACPLLQAKQYKCLTAVTFTCFNMQCSKHDSVRQTSYCIDPLGLKRTSRWSNCIAKQCT